VARIDHTGQLWRTATSKLSQRDGRSGVSGAGDNSACSQEPIHIPGAVQPHGALLAVDPRRDFTVIAASRNAAAVLGEAAAGGLIGRGIDGILGSDFADTMRQRFQDGRLRGEAPWQSTLKRSAQLTSTKPKSTKPKGTGQPPGFDVAVHTQAGLILVELEWAGAQDEAEALTATRELHEAIVDLRRTRSEIEKLARVTARGIMRLTGYERVLIYRFDTDWHGEAIGEVKVADWEQSLDGLHFPASDIPAQARDLYRRSPIRWVPDRDAVPVPIDVDPSWDPDRASELLPPNAIDLSFARLRAMSPIHLQYHRNMGVDGSLSLSILHEGQLWGLMVCHHRQKHHPSPGQRAAAIALTDVFALRVGSAERADTEQARRIDQARLSDLLAHSAEAEGVNAALTTGDVTISSLFSSTGAAVLYDGEITLLGRTPPKADVRGLSTQLAAHYRSGLFETDNMTAAYPPWQRFTDIASGVLAVFLSADRSDMVIWFRPEEPQLVSWGGSLVKGDADGAAVQPRQSFERWVETRRGFARRWAEWELEIAESLRHGITDVIVRSLRRITELNDQLRQSQKMEAVGQLTGGIAHDFNNLLTGIIGSLELMQIRVGQERYGDLERYIGAAVTSANRAASLTHRLLAFSRRQTLNPRAVDVNRLATSMEDLIRRTGGPAIHVETVMAGDLWKALCDANQLENALLNLAINARDAMPEGGRLTIAAANAQLDADYAKRHPAVAPGQYVAISVTDSGTGMAPDVVARVFEPFFTTKPLGQGTGLGLSMVYGFAKQSDGHIAIHSEIGQGTVVTLYLPRYLGKDDDDAANAGSPADNSATVGEVVLVVDDEPVLRMLIGDLLRDLGYGVVEAADGAEALRILESRQRIDLLVSDVGLTGGMNGPQLAEAALLHRPFLKVLFITGYAEREVTGSGVLKPDMEMIAKPFAMDVLAAKIRSMM
jgi:light-regulated signal transduction histidine kinase (bacteriophytochrome)